MGIRNKKQNNKRYEVCFRRLNNDLIAKEIK